VSIAFNGATLGGVLVAPALIPLIEAVGFSRALAIAAAALLAVLLPIAGVVMRRGPETLGLGPDGDPAGPALARPGTTATGSPRSDALRTWRFWSVSASFALGLAAQVGVLTHQVSLLAPVLGPGGAARAVSVTTAAAIIGRLLTGLMVDRLNRRLVASVTMIIQMFGVSMLALSTGDQELSPAMIYAGCALFGLGVGNLTTLPGLILAVEWPRPRFSALIGLVVGINQFTFAFGPSLVGVVRDVTGHYAPALVLCMALEMLAAAMVLRGPRDDGHDKP
jgi:cyanate permease